MIIVLNLCFFRARDGGVYVQTHGPRFETAAEIRQVAGFADVVGMTCCHEATLCKEIALPYAVICVVDNMANVRCQTNFVEVCVNHICCMQGCAQ